MLLFALQALAGSRADCLTSRAAVVTSKSLAPNAYVPARTGSALSPAIGVESSLASTQCGNAPHCCASTTSDCIISLDSFGARSASSCAWERYVSHREKLL